jgi:hypothetical protein
MDTMGLFRTFDTGQLPTTVPANRKPSIITSSFPFFVKIQQMGTSKSDLENDSEQDTLTENENARESFVGKLLAINGILIEYHNFNFTPPAFHLLV